MSTGKEAGVSTLPAIAEECAYIARAHGFHDAPRSIGEAAMLIVTEAAEFFESWRAGNDVLISTLAEELADVLIRTCDTAVGDLGLTGEEFCTIVLAKMEVNRHRPYRHGKRL